MRNFILDVTFQVPHVPLNQSTFTVGQGRQCDLCVSDPSVSKSLCNLKHFQTEVILSMPINLYVCHHFIDIYSFPNYFLKTDFSSVLY